MLSVKHHLTLSRVSVVILNSVLLFNHEAMVHQSWSHIWVRSHVLGWLFLEVQ